MDPNNTSELEFDNQPSCGISHGSFDVSIDLPAEILEMDYVVEK